ncbi:proteasome assembly chaperone 4 isoform X1 [Rhinolophus sinicus]|uniref:proteasome assembly chaperone 4 isoform X1 n=1 Tax=Rhinolophus sinicus TaxID=89399 RepID=UPI003D7B8E9A
MEGQWASAGGEVSLHNFSARLWEQLVHFHVMRLTDSLFLWVGATPHLRNLAVAMCSRYDSIPVSTSLLGDTSDTTSTGLAQRLETSAPAHCIIWNEASLPVLCLCACASPLDLCPLHPLPGIPGPRLHPSIGCRASKCSQPLCPSLLPSQVLPPYPQHT